MKIITAFVLLLCLAFSVMALVVAGGTARKIHKLPTQTDPDNFTFTNAKLFERIRALEENAEIEPPEFTKHNEPH